MYEITAVRLEPSDDASHFHVAVVGYESPHTPGEPIMVPIPRILEKMALGEKFSVRNGEGTAEVTPGKCRVCGFEPYLQTSADPGDRTILLTLPQK